MSHLVSETFGTREAKTEMPARQDDRVAEVAHADDAVSTAVVIIVVVFVLKQFSKAMDKIDKMKL